MSSMMRVRKLENLRSKINIEYFAEERKKTSANCGRERSHNAWNIIPLDLTPKIYYNRKTKKKIYRNYNSMKDVEHNLPVLTLPHSCHRSNREKGMLTTFRMLSADTDRRKAAKTGFYNKGKYEAARPRDFDDDIYRPLAKAVELEQNDFRVVLEHDPNNIKFKNETLLKTLPELSTKPLQPLSHPSNTNFITNIDIQPKWDKHLILTQQKYQKGRDTKDILFDKIEEGLGWVSKEARFDRPNIYDNTTMDLLEITRTKRRFQFYHG